MRVRVRVPGDATNLEFASGDQVVVNVDEAGRFADILEDDARALLCSGLPNSVPWQELNPNLVASLGPLPKSRAVRVVDLQHAAALTQPVNPFDRAGIVRQTLSMWRGGR